MRKNVLGFCLIILCAAIILVSCSKWSETNFVIDKVSTSTDESSLVKDPAVKAIVSSPIFRDINRLSAQFLEKFEAHCRQLSDDDRRSVINLGLLYKTDQQKYGVLLEEKLKDLLKDDYDDFCALLIEIRTKSESLNKKFNMAGLSGERSDMVLNKFAIAVSADENIAMRSMMASTPESNYQACVNACNVSRDTNIDFANKAFGCTVGVGAVAWCAGLAGGAWWLIGTFAAAYLRDEEVRNANTNHTACVAACAK